MDVLQLGLTNQKLLKPFEKITTYKVSITIECEMIVKVKYLFSYCTLFYSFQREKFENNEIFL